MAATSTSGHNYGTMTTLDLIATIQGQTVLEYGEQGVFDAIQQQLAFHNRQVNELLASFVEVTTDQTRAVGSATQVELDPMDEFTTPDAQKPTPSSGNLGFPLRKYGSTLQWTRTYFEEAQVAEFANDVFAFIAADRRNLDRVIRRALFNPLNYTFRDRLVKHYNIPVKALANADSFIIPRGINNEYFDPSTHTHYAGISAAVWNSTVGADITTSAAAVAATIANVQEHYTGANVLVYISAGQEAKFRTFTSNFSPYLDQRLAYLAPSFPGASGTYAKGELDVAQTANRAIGLFGSAEVWVKSWMPAGYIFAWTPDAKKTLAMRIRKPGSGDFRLVYDDENHPLRANTFAREMGMAVQNRINGAVLYINPANTNTYAWADSTIA